MCVIEIHAQKMYVESFVEKTNDITARRYPRTDFVGDDCALVKVLLAASGAVFEGNVVDDVSYHTSEYYVYMVQDSKRLTVKLEGYLPLEVNFEDFGFRSLEGKTVYLLTISGVSSAQHFESPKIKTGWIVLDSEPSGASVYINNEFVGYTPLSNYKQAYGTYQYRLESPNYHPSTGIIELNAGRFEQKVVLKPAFGSIFVNSNVAGAKIILDGKQTGRQTPATLSEIPSGPHTITLQMDKYAPRQQNVIVEDGQTTDVSLTLEARFARVTINSLSGAEIYCNGKLLGRRGRISEDMMEGYYDLEARLAHHRSVTKQIQVVAGQSQDITLNPIPKYGSLDIVSTPHDATVVIDGETMGKTPLTVDQLLEGEHHIAITLEGYSNETKMVRITENELTTIDVVLKKEVEKVANAKAGGSKQSESMPANVANALQDVIAILGKASKYPKAKDRESLRIDAINRLVNLMAMDSANKSTYSRCIMELKKPITLKDVGRSQYIACINILRAIPYDKVNHNPVKSDKNKEQKVPQKRLPQQSRGKNKGAIV